MTSGMKIRMQMCVWTNNIKIYENSRLIYGNSRLKRTSNNQALTRLFYRSRRPDITESNAEKRLVLPCDSVIVYVRLRSDPLPLQ